MHRFIFGAALVVAFGTAIHVPGTAEASERAGQTTRVQPDSYQGSGFFPDWLEVGDEIYREAKVYTEQYGSLEILFDDGTNLTLSPNSEIVVDEFVYSPDQDTGKAVISLGVGALRMISGRMRSESYQVRTKAATIGVRGTEFLLDTNTDGLTRIWIEDGTVLATTAGSGQTFEFDAPAYAECSAAACQEQSPAAPPTSFPTPPANTGPEQPDAGDGGGGSD